MAGVYLSRLALVGRCRSIITGRNRPAADGHFVLRYIGKERDAIGLTLLAAFNHLDAAWTDHGFDNRNAFNLPRAT